MLFYLAALCGMRDLSSPSRDWTHAPWNISRFLATGQPGKSNKEFLHIYLNYLFILTAWVFVALCRLSLVVENRGVSLPWLLWLQSTGSRLMGSVIAALRLSSVAHGLSCSEARGIFLNQGSNRCLLLWQMYSYPLHHRSAPIKIFDGWGFL